MSPFKVTTGDGKSEDDEKYKTLQQKKEIPLAVTPEVKPSPLQQ